MIDQHAVLCVGLDWHLLNTRMQTLRAAGFQVSAARDDAQARLLLRFFRFHAMVLCHSSHHAVGDDLVPDLRTIQPELPILELREEDQEPGKLVDVVLSVMCEGTPGSSPKLPYLSCWARCVGLERTIIH